MTAVSQFNAAVRERMQLANCSRVEATKIVAKSDKKLHQAYLLETNWGERQRRLIHERFQFEKETP